MNALLTFANVAARRVGLFHVARVISLIQILLATWNTLARAGYVPDIRLRDLGGIRRDARPKKQSTAALTASMTQPAPRTLRLDFHPAALLTFFALPLGFRAEEKYRSMPLLAERPGIEPVSSADRGPSSAVVRLPSLSIIIPARNEAKNLQRLLPSLRALNYPGELEIIVVDDQSTDGTGKIAGRLGAQVETVESLPPGWHGKPHACHVGALAARGDWLLFTDADTVHTTDSASRAVSFAHDHALDGLTLFLKQTPTGILDGAALTSAFAGLFAGTRDTNALTNGQYILLRRNVYLASGGFEAVRDQSLEDLALGNRLRKFGYTVVALNGETAANVRMYESPTQMWHGMTRLGAGSLEWSGSSGLLTVLVTTALMSPLVVLLGVLTGGLRFAWLPITWVASSVSVVPFARRIGSVWLALFAPVGALVVLIASVWGLVSRVLGRGIHWRGREV